MASGLSGGHFSFVCKYKKSLLNLQQGFGVFYFSKASLIHTGSFSFANLERASSKVSLFLAK